MGPRVDCANKGRRAHLDKGFPCALKSSQPCPQDPGPSLTLVKEKTGLSVEGQDRLQIARNHMAQHGRDSMYTARLPRKMREMLVKTTAIVRGWTSPIHPAPAPRLPEPRLQVVTLPALRQNTAAHPLAPKGARP